MAYNTASPAMATKTLEISIGNVFIERTVRNFLDIFILDLLRSRSRHGYELMQQLEEQTGTRISPGTLYPLLYSLEEQGLVIGRWSDPLHRDRRIYQITVKGENYHKDSVRSIESLLQPMNENQISEPILG